ncbi:putative endo-1,4-beta-xylanase B [Candidatus Sulfopaludibacter sp. SbA3]|nr:putative endo-1,4-beta-xylanase B [Candidatus Sulfopaludibacter sp. SbA3]
MRLLPVCALFLLSGPVLAADSHEIPLWAHGAPGSEGKTAKEVDEAPNQAHGYLKVTGVHNPSLTVFMPPADKATGAALIIAPGGGHQFLNFDQEGTYVAEYLNSIGVVGLVLKYRLAREPGSTYTVEGNALADAQRAIRMVRSRAAEGHINPARIGIMGFSAGGEVAALAATRFDAGKPDAADEIDRASSRPDFDALIYPGIRADGYTIPQGMPVTFMLCADNDRGPATALSVLYPKLKAAGVQTEVHIYATGGHGFGINPNTKNPSPAATSWQVRLGDWLKEIGMLKVE